MSRRRFGEYQQYIDIKFTSAVHELVETMEKIIGSYGGLRLTVRQLYYQLVAKAVIPNTMRSYKRIVKICTDGRLAGLIAWDGIEDRARAFQGRQRWDSGVQIMQSAAKSYHRDMWAGQDERPFVLIEKEALSGVLANLCYEYDVPLLACKGYPSATVLRDFAIGDIRNAIADGQRPIILHLGDHDPSGIDMTRDMVERLTLFLEIEDADVNRLALNMPQVERLRPPPNPAKQTDARFARYVAKFGRKCWELDALPPEELQSIVRRSIVQRIDWDKWNRRKREIEAMKKKLQKHANKFKG